MSKLEVDAIEPQSGTTLTLGASGDTINLASGATAGFGKVLQVVEDTSIASFSTTSTSVSDTGYSITITPSATNSKIIVIAYGNWSVSGAGRTRIKMVSNSSGSFLALNGEADYAGWTNGNVAWMGSIIGVEPNVGTTSPVTYKVQAACISSGITWYVPIDNSYASIIAYEIAG